MPIPTLCFSCYELGPLSFIRGLLRRRSDPPHFVLEVLVVGSSSGVLKCDGVRCVHSLVSGFQKCEFQGHRRRRHRPSLPSGLHVFNDPAVSSQEADMRSITSLLGLNPSLFISAN